MTTDNDFYTHNITIWRRNAMTMDSVEITSPHPMYSVYAVSVIIRVKLTSTVGNVSLP